MFGLKKSSNPEEELPLPPSTEDILEDLKKAGPDDVVFTTNIGDLSANLDQASRSFHFQFQCLRLTAASAAQATTGGTPAVRAATSQTNQRLSSSKNRAQIKPCKKEVLKNVNLLKKLNFKKSYKKVPLEKHTWISATV